MYPPLVPRHGPQPKHVCRWRHADASSTDERAFQVRLETSSLTSPCRERFTTAGTGVGCYTALRQHQAIDEPGPAGTLVGAVGRDGCALLLTGPDDAIGTGRSQVVSASRQRG